MDGMDEIKQTFFQECDEQLTDLETGLLAIQSGDDDDETINAVFRAVHSIKGGAGAFQLEDLVRFSHTFETTLDLIRQEKLEATAAVLQTMLRASDVLADLVDAARTGSAVSGDTWHGLVDELALLSDSAPVDDDDDDGMGEIDFQPIVLDLDFGDPEETSNDPQSVVIRFEPKPELYANANDPCLLLRELTQLGECEVTCDIDAVPALDQVDPNGSYLSWTVNLTSSASLSDVREVFEFVEDDCLLEIETEAANLEGEDTPEFEIDDLPEIVSLEPETNCVEEVATVEPPAAAPSSDTAEATAAKAPVQQTIRVDLDRVDRLINLVGELVINQAMLSQSVSAVQLDSQADVMTGLEELEQLTRELQESVMAIRAQPVKSLFQRMGRTVREAAQATEKAVRLHTEGEMTEVDKTVIDRLADPLTHMIRNAVDHGLEKPEQRAEAGKPEEGTVKLSAAHRSGRVVIEISDDGAGIKRERVRQIAVDKGIISEDAQLTDNEIDNLIFAPGFSTATEVSDLSGRGVGMDVVRRSIEGLGGRISITSTPGHGSIFSLSLPLTLAVLDGMIVTVGEHTLVVPITAIVETLKPTQADIHSLGADGRVVSIRDQFVPLIDTQAELGFEGSRSSLNDSVIMLVETDKGNRSALLFDAIQDQSQVVIKSLETNYGQVEGIAAATILGDGRVALILDVDALVSRSREPFIQSEPQLALAG